MKTNLQTSESKFLERCRIALSNAEAHETIASAILPFGYDTAKIAEGTSVYNNAKKQWETKQKEEAESRGASLAYKNEYYSLQAQLKRDRDRANIWLGKTPEVIIKLGSAGSFPTKYANFFDAVKRFYTTIKEDTQVAEALQPINLTPEIATQRLTALESLMAKRAEYDTELGESQDATKSKNTALLELKNWMNDFDRIAKVALYDQPQLLEARGVSPH